MVDKVLKQCGKILDGEKGGKILGIYCQRADVETIQLFLRLYKNGERIDGYNFYGDVRTVFNKLGLL